MNTRHSPWHPGINTATTIVTFAMVAQENSTDEELAELQAELDRLHQRLTRRRTGEHAESVTQ
ncbi:MAG TPA: hypothetical protein VJ755_13195 [Gemmatimonadales bacterium]|nr:hypothetical protein [Gemmatimonadales bacterium]